MSLMGFTLTAIACAAVAVSLAWGISSGKEDRDKLVYEDWGKLAYLATSVVGGAAAAGSGGVFAQLSPEGVLWLCIGGGVIAAGFGFVILTFQHSAIEWVHERPAFQRSSGVHEGPTSIRRGRLIGAEVAVITLMAGIPVIMPAMTSVIFTTAVRAVEAKLHIRTLTADIHAAEAEIHDLGDPVYNATAEPNGGAPNILLNRVATRVFFNIGPANLANMINKTDVSRVLLEELTKDASTPLAVVMTCYICESELPQTRFIRYSAPRKNSTVAEFAIVPDFDVAQERRAQSISFSIRRNGNELDFLNVPIRIQQGSQASHI
jgi:hypothetical protein